jgi:hypothetical protein
MLCHSTCANGFPVKVTHGLKNAPLLLNAALRPTSWYVPFQDFVSFWESLILTYINRVVPLLSAALSSRYTVLRFKNTRQVSSLN